ncbi:23107_t:CDS:2, partial [Dentiscutata erythropus]
MAIRLIGFGDSICTLRVITCLNELGLSYKLTPQAGGYAGLKNKDYLANKHPFGKVPVLYDDNFKITESPGLVEQLISYESSYFDSPVSKILFQEIYAKYMGKTSDPVVVKRAREKTEGVLNVYDKLLEGKEYLNGKFSLAELFHYPNTYFAHIANHSDLWDKKSNVKKWWDGLNNRDAWKKSLEDIK